MQWARGCVGIVSSGCVPDYLCCCLLSARFGEGNGSFAVMQVGKP